MSLPPDQHDELVRLLGVLRDGQIPSEDFAWLEQVLREDADARQLYVRFMTLHASLEQIGSVDVVAEQVRRTIDEEETVRELRAMIVRDMLSESTSRRHRWSASRYLGTALAAAAVIAVVCFGSLFVAQRNDAMRSVEITALYGRVELSGTDKAIQATPGMVVEPGHSVTTGPRAYIRLRCPDGSTIDLNADTEVTLGASGRSRHLMLAQGDVFATVSPRPRGAPLLVNPGRYDQVRVAGTSFGVKCRASGETRVRVMSGAVVFGLDGRSLRVEAGHESVASLEQTPAPPKKLDPATVWHGLSRGLTATYYDNEDFTGKSITRVDNAIDFDWKKSSPDPVIHPDTFSARWIGAILAEHTEPYTFYVVADGGVRLWVDGQLVIDRWKDKDQSKLTTRAMKLIAARRYDFKLEYYDHKGAANIKLWWSSPSTTKAIVPQSQFYPSAEPNNG